MSKIDATLFYRNSNKAGNYMYELYTKNDYLIILEVHLDKDTKEYKDKVAKIKFDEIEQIKFGRCLSSSYWDGIWAIIIIAVLIPIPFIGVIITILYIILGFILKTGRYLYLYSKEKSLIFKALNDKRCEDLLISKIKERNPNINLVEESINKRLC